MGFLCNRCGEMMPNWWTEQICDRCQREDKLKARLIEAEAEIKRLKDWLFLKCVEAEKLPNGQCRGFQVSQFDDEPIEQCKNCQKFDLYDPEELVEDCPEDWDEEGEHDD
jgi:hypothetical protein